MENNVLDANLIKKYHQDIVFNYAEYPTKDHWSFDFNDTNYKNALLDWLPKNKINRFFSMYTYHIVSSYAGFVHVEVILKIIIKLKST